MTVDPVLPVALLLVLAAVVVALRAMTLRPALAAGRSARWRWSALTAALLLLLLAALRPALLTDDRAAGVARDAGADTNVFLVVDRSADSAVGDYSDGQPRMAGIRADITALIERYPQARFAVLGFAARPSLDWPLSEDIWSLQPVINRLAPYDDATAATTQVNAAAAATVLRYQLIGAAAQHPDSQNLVFYFGSGAGSSRAPQGDFDPVAGSVDGGAVYGYGTREPPAGAAPLDEPALRRIAGQLGVPYVARTDGRPLPEAGADTALDARAAAELTARIELYWVLTAVAAALLLAEIFWSLREVRRDRLARREVLR